MIKNIGKRIAGTLTAAAALLPALQLWARADIISDPFTVVDRYFYGDSLTLWLFITAIVLFIASVVFLILTLVKCKKKGKKIGLSILFGFLILISFAFIALTFVDMFFWW